MNATARYSENRQAIRSDRPHSLHTAAEVENRYASAYPARRAQGRKKRSVRYRNAVRLVFVSLLLLIGFTFGVIFHAYAGGPNDIDPAPSAVVIDVGPGDTLWSIASEHAPKGTDTRLYVHKMQKLNGLKNASLQVGQMLKLP